MAGRLSRLVSGAESEGGGVAASVDRHEAFYRLLRRRIVSGAWGRGARIPNRLELVRELDTSLGTMQKALDRLKTDGFVRARGRAGTFVSERLPAQYQVGLALGGEPEPGRPGSRVWQALEYEANRIDAAGRWRVKRYFGVSNPDSPGRAALERDIAGDCLAGVLYAAMSVVPLAGTALVDPARLRVLAMAGDAEQAGLSVVKLPSYLDKVLDYLQGLGRRRFGLVNSALAPANLGLWQKGLADRGLVFDPYRTMTAFPVESDTARVAVYHMMRQAAAQRPDALLVTDDHLVEPVTQGLRDAGVNPPRDVLVVAHCNYPLPPPHHVPVTFIGFDLAEILDQAVERLAPAPLGGRVTHRPPTSIFAPAKFDHELPPVRRETHRITPAPLPVLSLAPDRNPSLTAFG